MSYLFPTYQRWEIEPESAYGSRVIDKEGKVYLDFTSGIGVCNLGHRPKNVEEAVSSQLNRFWHVSNLFCQEEQEMAAGILAKAAGMDRVFFANSGAEANEAAIKLSRKATGRNKIITFQQSFHGRTFATMAATGQEKIKSGYGSMLETFVHLPFNDVQALETAIDEETAAVMLEIVQGEGGIHPAAPIFLEKVAEACKQTGALLVIDEIQTGIGRTGKAFAFQHFGLAPDVVTVAKGLGSGFPIGAVIGKESLKEVFGPGSHGSTFGGNPISIAAAQATMETIFNEGFLKEISMKSNYLIKKLKDSLGKMDVVEEIRGLGMMIGIQTLLDPAPILKGLRDRGLIVLPAGEKVIRLLPPLTASNEEIDEAIVILADMLSGCKKQTV